MMSSVYGSFIEHFSELMETFNVWTFPDKSDIRTVRAVLIPNKGSSIKRRKYTSGNTGLDIVDSDDFYIGRKYYEHVKTGDYISKVSDNIIMRLTAQVPFDKAAGYRIYKIELVTGATSEDTQQLQIREASFD